MNNEIETLSQALLEMVDSLIMVASIGWLVSVVLMGFLIWAGNRKR